MTHKKENCDTRIFVIRRPVHHKLAWEWNRTSSATWRM